MEIVPDADLKEYALIKDQIKKLEEKAAEWAAYILEKMQAENAVSISSPYGTYFTQVRTSYKYPESIKKAELKVKELKKKAEEKGTATATVTTSLAFRSNDLAAYME